MKFLKSLLFSLFAFVAFTGHAATSTTLDMTWTAPTTNTDGTAITAPITYNVYRLINGSYTLVTSGIAATSYTVTGLSPNTAYTLHVTAVVNGIESGASQNVTGSTLPPPLPPTPNAPTNVSVQ